MMNAALKLEGIGKRYHRRTSLRGMLTELAGLPEGRDAFWALRDVSLEVARGECLGIVGHNGAGKSTLLKVLSRITPPTAGRYRICGRLGSLIEVGAGFHPELTGRENVYLAGAIHGMKRREVAKKFDAILEFAGLREFLDMPVKRYSSGMFVRLGFSVAVHTQPDVLLVDEVLAVGDRAFRAKCLDYFRDLRARGCAVVLVSHHLDLIQRLCDRAVLFDHGRLADQGEPEIVLDAYRSMEPDQTARPETQADVEHEDIGIEALEVLSEDGTPAEGIEMSSPVTFRLRYRAQRAVPQAVFAVGLISEDGTQVTAVRNDTHGVPLPDLPAGRGHVDVRIDGMHLLPGRYAADARILDGRSNALRCWRSGMARFQVLGGYTVKGFCHIPHTWRAPEADA